METPQNIFLIIGAILNSIAALLHLACLYFGAPLFRFLGTEEMARMYERGNLFKPVIACVLIATLLFVWTAYTLSGAGVIHKLPFLRLVLMAITVVYLVRGSAFPFLIKYFPGNSMTFWYCSSLIVFGLGIIHLFGLVQVWRRI